ncbi:MAG: PQQ-binding-like beta-propeller repeat protein [Pirellulales bacterium]
MKRRRMCNLVAAAAGLGILIPSGLASLAQAPQPAAPPGVRVRQVQIRRNFARNAALRGDDELAADGVFLPPDRQAKRRLELAGELIGERRFGEAVRLLGSLLEDKEDFFFKPDAEEPVFRSLKAEAGRLLAELPPQGRESYELQFGSQARQTLKEAAAAGDLAQVAEVSRRFFFTHAGACATFLLGRHYLDQNRPLFAALCFERLLDAPDAASRLEPALSLSLASCWLRSGKPEKAQQTLAKFRRSQGSAEVVLAGKPVKLFAADGQALAWMEQQFGKQPLVAPVEADQWVMFRGDESRNAPSSGGQPLLSTRWRQRTSDDRAIEEFVAKQRHDYISQDIVALSSMHPLAVSDVVLMRTAFALQAVDFETGKLVWRYATGDESLEQFLTALGSQQTGATTQKLFSGLDDRMWEDATYGTLASDGERVFYIEDLGLAGLTSNVMMTVLPNGQRRYSVNTRGTNRLAARELRTQGKLKWEVGGITGEDEPKLAGAFFLGPPLPLLGSLYALAEVKGQEIRLVVLAPETGALEWSQQLAVVDPPVTVDEFRRNSGATPSFADGVLVCPTTAGAIVGIDLTTRSLLWGYQYPRQQQYPMARFRGRAAIYAGTEGRSDDHWADASITIADGRVLVTPIETDQLYCLSLVDGEELWKQSRGKNLYVACVHQGTVILVGHNSVSAVNLADGTKAWPELQLPERSMPSGRGFYSGEHYHLPLSSAEVAQINLRTGQIESRARSRGGNVPGNLVCYRDSIVSQGADYLEAYYQLDALKERIAKTLAAKPDDPGALAALGEVKLDEGALAEAIELFRRSYALVPDETTRGQLIESLLAGLRVDFAAYREHLAELERLVEQPRHRLDFLRLKAIGLQKMGEIMPAFETYMKLVDEQAPWELEVVDERLSVRRDRWIRQQLALLREAADPAGEQAIDAVVKVRLDEALGANSADALRTFVSVFGSQPAAARAREALVEKLSPDDLLEKSVLLERQASSSNDAEAAPAVARLASALRAGGQANLAAVYYRQLAGPFAKVRCKDDKTGRQLVDELPADDPVRAGLAPDEPWPEGNVAIREEKGSIRGTRTRRSERAANLEIIGPSGPLFENVSLSLTEDSRQYLIAEDGFGENRFHIPLTEQGMRRMRNGRNAYNAPSVNYGSVYGGLMVLSLGNQLIAVDTLRGGDASANRILWMEDLNDQIGGLATMQSIVPRPVNVKWGPVRYVAEDGFGRRFGTIGPVHENGVYFQRLHDLHCLDPLSGKVMWTRKNVASGVDLFGDDEYLFAAPAADGETLVLRAATGELLGKRRIAPVEARMATVGRQVLTWQEADGHHVMEMRDAWLDRAVWSYTFPAGSKAAIASHEVVGVFQPDGRFSLVRLADGKQLADERLQPENTLMGIYLLPSDAVYTLVVHAATRTRGNVQMQPFPTIYDCPLVSGRVYAFDRRSGKQRWPSPVLLSQHGLWLSQPADLPVLVFIRQIHQASSGSARIPNLSVMCIDKRSGRVVYQNDDLTGTTVPLCDVYCDPRSRTVTISLPTRLITLTYTHDAAEPQAALPPPDRSGDDRALVRARGPGEAEGFGVKDAISQ